MSTLYQRVAPSEPSESTTIVTESRTSLDHGAAMLQSGEARNEGSKDGPSVASEALTGKGTVILRHSLSKGHLLEWLIHFFAISISIGICSLHFKQQYWTDESVLSKKWRWVTRVSLDLNDIIKGLQYVAKVHEILIVASIGAIVLYFARRRLVGDEGITLGLLMSSYRIDRPANMLSSKFWSALSLDASSLDPATVVLSLLLLVSAILCQLVGPASAGVMQPSLGWWNVSDPYNGQMLPLSLSVRNDDAYPQALDQNTWPLETYNLNYGNYTGGNATACLIDIYSSFWCPAFGLSSIATWVESNYENHAAPNITMTGTSGTQRTLTADLIANGTAIAATHSNWVIRMFGLFATYVKHHPLLTASPIALPMYTTTDAIYAPVVQVQCAAFLVNESTSTVTFLADQLTNYTNSGAERYHQVSWPVPRELWKPPKRPNRVYFTWYDFSKDQDGQQQTTTDMWRPSLGAVAKIPGWVYGQPDFYTIPCVIDARWAASSATYQPTISDIVISNLSNPAALTLNPGGTYSISSNSRPKRKTKPKSISLQSLGIGDPIQIGTEWANTLNAPGFHFVDTQDLTAIEMMLMTYIRGNENNTRIGTFTVGINNDTYLNDTTELMHAAANTTATILSLTIADALSRLGDAAWNMIALNTTESEVTWTAINFDYYDIRTSPPSFIQQFMSLRIQVHRYGWAYGLSAVVILNITVLLMHVFMVFSYAGYHLLQVLCFKDRWWVTNAWNNAAELIMLAWHSSPPKEAKPSIWAQNIKVREKRDGPDNEMELVGELTSKVSSVRKLHIKQEYM
ncbi:hypothetical protein MKX08_005736 [Trichoderma sp. CBMAI-0020]|nr:hypothetical protein MKX08_005736 [Trichoderma sp. CBMAI-0020]